MNIIQLETLREALVAHASRVYKLFYTAYERDVENKETIMPILERYRTELLNTNAKIKEIKMSLKDYYNQNNYENGSSLDRFTLKAFKHEFLSELQYHNGSLEELINNTLAFFPELPRININNYVRHLFLKGYFKFLKPTEVFENLEDYIKKHPDYEFRDSYLEDENCQIVITEKALRYLENEANISLKRKI